MKWRDQFRRALDGLVNDDYLLQNLNKRWTTNLVLINGFILILSLIMLVIYLFRGNVLSVVGDFFAMCVCVASLSLLLVKRRHKWSLFVFAIGMMFYAFFLLLFGFSELYLGLWLLAYPICVCFFLGNTFARPYLTLLLGAILLILSPVFDPWRTAAYSPTFCAQLPMLFVVFCLLGLAIEYIHQRTGKKLVTMARYYYESANQDQLTRLYNRRAFYDVITREQARERRHQGGLQMILCDIDHFKVINDRYGHQQGDDFLVHVASLFKSLLRSEDYCFRWGGEEFLLLLPNTLPAGGRLVANRLREAIEVSPMFDRSHGKIATTISFGVHAYDGMLSVEDNIAQADACLYAAKKNGRNRVEMDIFVD